MFGLAPGEIVLYYIDHTLRCVAMDNRGYGESDKPKNQRDYSVDKLADDVANLAKHLGRDNFILVGHDWGGAIGYEERVTIIEKIKF